MAARVRARGSVARSCALVDPVRARGARGARGALVDPWRARGALVVRSCRPRACRALISHEFGPPRATLTDFRQGSRVMTPGRFLGALRASQAFIGGMR